MADLKENVLNKELLIKQDKVADLKQELKSRIKSLTNYLKAILFMDNKETVTIKMYKPDYINILFNQLEEDGSEAFHGSLRLYMNFDKTFYSGDKELSISCSAMTITKVDTIIARKVKLLERITRILPSLEEHILEWQEDYASAFNELLVAEQVLEDYYKGGNN